MITYGIIAIFLVFIGWAVWRYIKTVNNEYQEIPKDYDKQKMVQDNMEQFACINTGSSLNGRKIYDVPFEATGCQEEK